MSEKEEEAEWSSKDHALAEEKLGRLLGRAGWLRKQGEHNKTWRRRWFSLGAEPGAESRLPVVKLYYYEQQNDRRHINFILLAPSSRAEPSALVPKPLEPAAGFCIRDTADSSARIYWLAAESEDEQIEWVTTIRNIVFILSLRGRQSLAAEPSLAAPAIFFPENVASDSAPAAGSKAAKLLRGPVSDLSASRPGSRASLDVIVERASGLAPALYGKNLVARVAYVNRATCIFTWWEFSPCGSSQCSNAGDVDFHCDFSFESAGIGSDLIVRLCDARSNVILGEAMFDPLANLKAGQSGGGLAVDLGIPRWEEGDESRAGGLLADEDVCYQGLFQLPYICPPPIFLFLFLVLPIPGLTLFSFSSSFLFCKVESGMVQ